MSDVIAYAVFAVIMVLAVRSIVWGIRRGNRDGWHFWAGWVRRLLAPK